jgi:hypothetical protein
MRLYLAGFKSLCTREGLKSSYDVSSTMELTPQQQKIDCSWQNEHANIEIDWTRSNADPKNSSEDATA